MSLGWKWDKTRRTDPARVSRHWLVLSVATLLALAYGTTVEDAQDRRIAPGNLAGAAQGAGSQSPGPSEPSGAHRQRNPLRHRLAEAFAAQRTPLEPRLAAAPNPGRNPSPTWRSRIMRPRNSPYLPLSGGDIRAKTTRAEDTACVHAVSSPSSRQANAKRIPPINGLSGYRFYSYLCVTTVICKSFYA